MRAEGESVARLCAHRFAINLAPTLAALFRAVHRSVGIDQQRESCIIGRLLGKKRSRGDGDSHAGTRGDLDPLDDVLSGDARAQALGNLERE